MPLLISALFSNIYKMVSIFKYSGELNIYMFIFQGIWSDETHPKDYPFAVWLTHFSDVIGASHDQNFSFWGDNHIATDGFRSLAEWGSVRLLEIELRAKAPRLKTLIKADGLWYPDVNTNTSSHFRVDRKKYKVSLVSMFGPSPDWVVGISGLNLCRADCTWIESLDIDLYPWDSGTDSGISYMSANAETQPREKMRRITTMYPEDPRAPFYNPTNLEMTPLAKLFIRREKVISRPCDFDLTETSTLDDSENTDGPIIPECKVTEYTNWTACSVICGKGIRTRSRNYINNVSAEKSGCKRQLISREMCVSDVSECANNDDRGEEDDSLLGNDDGTTDDQGEGIGICETTTWSEWSPCSATCGGGITMKTRYFINHLGNKKCPHVTIVEKQKCMSPECLASDIESPDPLCPVGQWSDWSPCSVSCGSGVTIRKRLLLVEPDMIEFCFKRLKLDEQRSCVQKQECRWNEQITRMNCGLDEDIGPCRGNFIRYFYNKNIGNCVTFTYGGCRGNLNNFLTYDECNKTCNILKQEFIQVDRKNHQVSSGPIPTEINCELSEWGPWTSCSVSCDFGRQMSRRYILRGTTCNTQPRLIKHRKCYTSPCN